MLQLTRLLRPRVLAVALAACTVAGASSTAVAAGTATADIAYEQFTLPNGLRVIVHTDRKAPIVAVNLWYHVGSKDEPAGRTGFAHLFEHLMFNGSENHKGEFFEPFELVGATDMNGTTNSDRTNYFENVPSTALDMALWMESDRMGHLLGAIDQKTLDEQRGVVQNEKRQGENQPYGQVWEKLGKAMYPKGHPYHHSVIGSMNDLNAASLEDVKNWFRTWYGPNNSVLVLAGDIDVATAKEKVAKYFGDIPATPTMAQPKVDVPRRPADTREVMTDKVPQSRIYKVWNVPQTGTEDLDRLQLLARVLGGSRTSRLDSRLLHKDKLVDSVSTMVDEQQLASNFMVTATVKKGVDPAKVEKIIDEELERLLHDGPTAGELARAKTGFQAGFIRGIERIGGFGGKADALASCAIYANDPGCFRKSMATIEGADAAALQKAGTEWLGKGSHTLIVEPGERKPLAEEASAKPAPFKLAAVNPKYTTTPGKVDRSKGVQVPTEFPELKFPKLQRAKLKNGSEVILAQRHDIPVVQMSYQFNGGSANDPKDRLGTAAFAMSMMDEGAGDLGPLQFAEKAEALGADLGSGASLDGASVSLSALKEHLDPSLELFATMLRKPRFDQSEIDRVRATWIAGIGQEKARPQGAAQRVLPPLLYGAGHPYAIPFSGTGSEDSITKLTREDLVNYHKAWVRPQDATLIVVGDTTLEEIVPMLDRHLGDWKGEGAAPRRVSVGNVKRPAKPRLFLIDQPGAVQANIFAGEVVPPTGDPGSVTFDVANGVLGGEFSSRLNMNLREDKHWAYGAYSFGTNALGPRPWLAFAPVQIDKTAPALQEMLRDISQYASGAKPPTEAEVAKIQASDIRGLPGAYETADAVLGTIGGIVRYKRPDDWVFKRRDQVEALTPAQVQAAARTLDPEALTWVVVGDLKQIEQPLRALKLGEVQVLDADGKPVAAKPAAGTQ